MKNTNTDKRWWLKITVASSVLVIVLAIAAMTGMPNDSKGDKGMRTRGISLNQGGFAGDMNADMPALSPSVGKRLDSYSVNESADSALVYGIPPITPGGGGQTAAEADQRIIKTADLAISVDGVESKTQGVISIATGRGGFVQSSTVVEDEDGYKSGFVTVRVPSDSFEDAINAIKDLAVRVDRESVNGRDVTEQYTDLEARLRSAQAQEEQYLDILDQATTVQDILAVQSYLQSIRYEIESFQGQLQSLGNQTEYSTISVSLEEEVRVNVPAEKFDLGRDLKLALKSVVLLAQTALTFLVWFVIVGGALIIPLGLFIALVVWVIKKIIKRL